MAANGNVRINIDYDSKPIQDLIKQFNDMNQPIKTASNAIAGMVEDIKKNGQSTKEANKRLTELATVLGSLDTKAKQPRQALSELKSVLIESTDAYKKLTDQEKNSEFGKALKQSINQLTQRAKAFQTTLNDVQGSLRDTNSETKSTGVSFSDLTGLIGKISIAIGAASGAFKVLKDAFMTSESNVDSWGRTMEGAQALYTSFLSALNSMDISGYMGKISQIIDSAKEAYDALDELGTLSTIRSPERAKLEARQNELRATIRTEGKDSKAGKAAAAELKTIAPQLKQSYINEGKDNAEAFKKALREQLLANNINLSDADMNRLMPTFSNERLFKQFRDKARGSLSKKVVGSGDHEQVQTVDTRNLNQKIMDAVTDEWRQKYSPYLTAAMGARGQAAGVDLANSRYLKSTTSGGGKTTTTKAADIIPEGSIASAEKKLQDLQKAWKNATSQDSRNSLKAQIDDATKALDKMKGKVDEVTVEMATGASGLTESAFSIYIAALQEQMRTVDLTSPLYENLQDNLADANALRSVLQVAVQNGLDTSEFHADELWDKIINADNIPDSTWTEIENEINAQLQALDIKPITIDIKTGKVGVQQLKDDAVNVEKAWSAAGSAIGNIGNALSQIKDPTVNVMGIIAEAIANIALTFSKSLAGTFTPWEWIAAAASGTATMISTIAAIKSATSGYAAGGIINGVVGGSNYIDRVPVANVSSGEMVMNEADQNNLWNAIKSGNFGGGGGGNSTITGEQIVTVINAYGRRTGRGEILR